MSENQVITADVNSPEYTAALTLHQQIITNGTIAANALYEMCRCLKQMRDDKLYTALGYDDFGAYCEEKANIKARQAYSYIKTYEDLGKDFLQSNANLGITKLELLTHVNPLDRAEFMEQVDVGELSVNELRAEIDRLQRENGEKGEQLSMLEERIKDADSKTEELNKLKDDYTELAEKNSALENDIEELRNAPKEVAVAEPDPEEINKRVSEALAKNDKEHKKEVKALKAQIKEYESSAANIKDGYEKKLKALSEKLDSEKSVAEERVKALEERLKNANESDKARIEFEFYFSEMQEALRKFVDVLGRIDDTEKRNKFRGAAKKYIGMIMEELGGNEGGDNNEA